MADYIDSIGGAAVGKKKGYLKGLFVSRGKGKRGGGERLSGAMPSVQDVARGGGDGEHSLGLETGRNYWESFAQ